MLNRGMPADEQRSQGAQPNQRLREREAVKNRLTWAVCSIGRALKSSVSLNK